MFINAKNKNLLINNSNFNYVHFGSGKNKLILIPGLNLKGLEGSALQLAYMYRIFSKDYSVYIFDKLDVIPKDYTIKNIACDIVDAMHQLNIEKADFFGISQGGMIAQELAINYPELVNKVVLGVTASKQNDTMLSTINFWIETAQKEDYATIAIDIIKKMYSDEYIKKYQWLFPLLTKIGKPKSYERFINLAKACLNFNCYPELEKIKCPVFVIGGKKDKVLSGEASEEIAEKLKCQLFMYDYGHAAYDEAKDFNNKVLEFLQS